MKQLIGIIAAIVIIFGGYMWYEHSQSALSNSDMGIHATSTAPATSTSAETMGTYAYECDEHVGFTMTPAADMGSIAIAPSSASSTFPPAVTVYKEPASSGVRYTGGGLLFSARGETVTLSEGDSAINCSPVPSQDMAPFNFGD